MSRATYLYCVVRSGRKPRTAGVPPGLPRAERALPVRIDDGLWLVTASVPLDEYGSERLDQSLRDLDWVGRIALAHEAIVEYFVRAPGTAVIPMKLFTMFTSDARAAAGMRSRRRELDRVFDRIEGCEEWGVRVTRGKPASARKPPADASTGTEFLAARRHQRERTRATALAITEAAEAAFDALANIARAGKRRDSESEGLAAPILDAAFLVPNRRRARFRSTVDRLAGDVSKTGGRLTLSGPWPAYNFVDIAAAEERV